jgi:hypothetical protein
MNHKQCSDNDKNKVPAWRAPVFLLGTFCLLLTGAACFERALFRGELFGYRDAADFYFPLYQRIQQEWSAGRLPLWEPEENGGMPLLANPTSAVFYPLKVIDAILNYPWATRVYSLVHVAIAAWGMYRLARWWSLSRAGAWIAALGYSLGVPLIDCMSNVVFLVGASWMPFAFQTIDAWIRLTRWKALLGLGLVLALQTLGGDPQSAYVEIMMAIVYAFALSFQGSSRSDNWRPWAALLAIGLVVGAYQRVIGQSIIWGGLMLILARRTVRRRRLDDLSLRLFGLAGAAALALFLAGIQLLPSLEFMSQSTRLSGQGMQIIYRFSMSPFELIGCLCPNVIGGVKEGNTCWLRTIPPLYDATESWFPSLYLGMPTLVLGLSAAGIRGVSVWRMWLTLVLIIGLLAALGAYGSPLLWARWALGPDSPLGPVDSPEDRPDGLPGDGWGSPYWALTVLMPGFHAFRYPAKLLIPACLALSCLAGYGWDALETQTRRRILRLAAAIALLNLITGTFLLVFHTPLAATLEKYSELARTSFGPLDVQGTMANATTAVVHGSVAAALMAVVAWRASRHSITWPLLLLFGLSIDLILANREIVITVPQGCFQVLPKALKIIAEAERKKPVDGPFRIHRMMWSPSLWSHERAPNRPEQIVRWDRDTLRPKYAVTYKLNYTYTMGTAELLDYALFFGSRRIKLNDETTTKFGLKQGQQVVYFPRRGFDLWNTRYFIVPVRLAMNSIHRGYLAFLPNSTELYPPSGVPGQQLVGKDYRQHLMNEDLQVLRNEAAFPRAWIVHKALCCPTIHCMRIEDRNSLTNDILYQDDELWHEDGRPVFDPHRVAWVETDRPEELARALSHRDPEADEGVTLDTNEPQCVTMTAKLSSPGLVVLADVYYPGWRLQIDGRPAEILRTNRAMRGALVDAGKHRLVFTYEPSSFRYGVAATIFGLLTLTVGSLRFPCRPPSITSRDLTAGPDPAANGQETAINDGSCSRGRAQPSASE